MNMNTKVKEVLDKTNISHKEKYDCIIDLIGLDKLIPIIPFSKEEIENAYPQNIHLNNLSIKKWDLASGFITQNSDVFKIEHSYLHKLLYNIGVNAFSLAECVCLLKRVAIHMIGES